MMSGQVVWVLETADSYADELCVAGVFASRELAQAAMEAEGMTVQVSAEGGRLDGDHPAQGDRRRSWAIAMPYEVRQ